MGEMSRGCILEYYLLVCTTCTYQSGHRCPDCFGILLLRYFDVYGSQIGSTESGNPVWTYENRCRPIWAPSYGSSMGRQRAWRTCTTVNVQKSATCLRVAPHGPTSFHDMFITVFHAKL